MSIELTEKIRNTHFSKPLRSEEIKYYMENFALAVLRYCSDEYDNWSACDAPDLQSSDGTTGIEVTEVAIGMNRAIVGDCLHYWETGDVRYKNKAEQRGATAGDMFYILPSFDSNDELSALETIFRKKLAKLSLYKKRGFRKIGLIMVMDGLPIPSTAKYWADVVRVVQSASELKYDFVYFTYCSVLSRYDCSAGTVTNTDLDRSDYDALKKYARCIIEK